MSHSNYSFFEIGADVSKAEVYFYSEDGPKIVPNQSKKLKAYLTSLAQKHPHARVSCESTGSYHHLLILSCLELGVPVSIVNPLDVKAFIRSFGSKAKTDPIDARYICRFAMERQPKCLDQAWIQRNEVKELISFRNRLVDERARLKASLDKTTQSFIQKESKALIKTLTTKIEKAEAVISKLIAEDPQWASGVELLQSVKGVGPQVSRTLIVHMPELGTANRREIATLAGLAPMHHDSGQKQGRRTIRHGRKEPRKALYQAAVVAMRCNDEIKGYYRHLKAKGKPSKVCLIACAHKLLIHLNGLVKREGLRI